MAKQQVSKIEKAVEPEAETPSAAREAPIMKASALTWQLEGFHWREALVRLPAGVILQDLQDSPTIWKQVQSVPQTALRKLDRVTVIGFDEAFLVKDALVVDADNSKVVLAIKEVIRMTGKSSSEWSDDQHIIRWAGAGYGVFRQPGNTQVLPNVYGSVEAAKHAMYAAFYATRRVA